VRVVCVCLKTFAQMTDDDSALTSQVVAECVGQLPGLSECILKCTIVSGVYSCDVIDNSALQTHNSALYSVLSCEFLK